MGVGTCDYDYRLSHLGESKGQAYDASFATCPWRAHLWRQERRILNRIIGKHLTGRRIDHLDFACGTGRVLRHLSGQVASSTGIDVSESMLKVARARVSKAEIINGDITRRKYFGGKTFNLITAMRFFPNAQNQLRSSAIEAISRHLAPDGLFVFNNHKNSSSTLYKLGRAMGKRPRTMSFVEARRLVEGAGLTIVETRAMGVLPATDNHMLVPGPVHRFCDWLVGAFGLSGVLGQNVVFVCRKPRT